MNHSIDMSVIYPPSEIRVYIIDKFLFIEACHSKGVKGKNLQKFMFKTCVEMPLITDINRIRVFYSKNSVRISVGVANAEEICLPIDKSQARKVHPQTELAFYKRNTNEEIMEAFRLVGMDLSL